MRTHEKNVLPIRKIHETAVIHPGARLGKDVEIGPYAVIGENVIIGDGTKVGPHVVIDGWTKIGNNCTIYPSASIGAAPQDLKYKGEKTSVIIGDGNMIREFVTIHRGTGEGGETIIGNNNLFMANVHVAHDCRVGSNIIIANSTALAGHVEIEDRAVIGGLSGIHQFVKIGRLAMIGACSKVVQDVPPYIMVDGHPLKVSGINIVGLRRNNFSPELRAEIKRAFKILYRCNLNVTQAIEVMEQELQPSQEIDHLLRFLRNAQRGVCR